MQPKAAYSIRPIYTEGYGFTDDEMTEPRISSKNDKPIPGIKSDHPNRTYYDLDNEHPIHPSQRHSSAREGLALSRLHRPPAHPRWRPFSVWKIDCPVVRQPFRSTVALKWLILNSVDVPAVASPCTRQAFERSLLKPYLSRGYNQIARPKHPDDREPFGTFVRIKQRLQRQLLIRES